MPKQKVQKGPKGAAHVNARINYLYKIANYMQYSAQSSFETTTTTVTANIAPENGEDNNNNNNYCPPPQKSNKGNAAAQLSNTSRLYVSQMRGVSRKGQQRLPLNVKRSVCKRCDSLFIPEVTCSRKIANPARPGTKSKPWADLLVVECSVCGFQKRYPQCDRTPKLAERKKAGGQKQKPKQEPKQGREQEQELGT